MSYDNAWILYLRMYKIWQTKGVALWLPKKDSVFISWKPYMAITLLWQHLIEVIVSIKFTFSFEPLNIWLGIYWYLKSMKYM